MKSNVFDDDYDIKSIIKDYAAKLSEFHNISNKEALQMLGFDENYRSLGLGSVKAWESLTGEKLEVKNG